MHVHVYMLQEQHMHVHVYMLQEQYIRTGDLSQVPISQVSLFLCAMLQEQYMHTCMCTCECMHNQVLLEIYSLLQFGKPG